MSNIKIGDEVLLPGTDWLVVTDIDEQSVRTRTKGTITFTKLYFGEKHPPVYSYEILDVRNTGRR